jgi:transposase
MSLAHVLQYQLGITARKVPAVLALTLGLRVTQSAITQAAVRNSLEQEPIGAAYKSLRAEIATSEQVNTDDTSWRTAARDSYLMAFATKTAVVYQVRDRHTAVQVNELIPSDYQGVLGSDRFKSYNAVVFNDVKQQKCLFHIVKNLKQDLEQLRGRARDFPLELRALFKTALKLQQQYRRAEMSLETYHKREAVSRRHLTRSLRTRKLPLCHSSERIRAGLALHHQRGDLLRFLDDPSISATNNAAERALRPNVIFRKLCDGSKTDSGARALEAFSSVIQTARVRGESPVKVLAGLYAKRR